MVLKHRYFDISFYIIIYLYYILNKIFEYIFKIKFNKEHITLSYYIALY